MRPVKNKTDFVRRYKAGEFGNAGPTWESYDAWWNENRAFDHRKYHLRNRIPGGRTFYNLEGWKLATWGVVGWVRDPNWYVSGMAPHDRGTIQGEVSRTPMGLTLSYGSALQPMRDMIQSGGLSLVSGVQAKMLLQSNMNTNSWEWLQYLLDEYKDHVIEFTCFSVCWGTIPGYNTVFWEVRPDRGFGSNLSRFTEVY